MSDLVAFLNARIDEDEAAARAAEDVAATPWTVRQWEDRSGNLEDTANVLTAGPDTDENGYIPSDRYLWDDEGSTTLQAPLAAVVHIARHDPARVLADCAVKRAVIALHTEASISTGHCGECMGELPCPTVRLFAQPYSGHPHFHPSWATD